MYKNVILDSFKKLKDKSSFSKRELGLISNMDTYFTRVSKVITNLNSKSPKLDIISDLRLLTKYFIPGTKVYTNNENKQVFIDSSGLSVLSYYSGIIVCLNSVSRPSSSQTYCYPLSDTLFIYINIDKYNIDINDLSEFKAEILNNLYSLNSSEEVNAYANLYFKIKLLLETESIKSDIATKENDLSVIAQSL